jgi:hypothetical protein
MKKAFFSCRAALCLVLLLHTAAFGQQTDSFTIHVNNREDIHHWFNN